MLSIRYGQVDPEAKGAINNIAVNGQQSWSNPADLGRDDREPVYQATLEDGYFVLSGELELFPNQPQGQIRGWWSAEMSGADGSFATPPVLDISFGSSRKSNGLTLYFYPFSPDYAEQVRVTWYDGAGVVLQRGTYTLESNVGEIRESVVGYQRVVYEFLKTNAAYRYLKLYALDFGLLRTFSDAEIDECQVLEEMDPISDILAVNTLNFTVRTRNPVFSPVSGEPEDEMMMKRQRLELLADGQRFGVFFVDTWKDLEQSGVHFLFTADDALAMMEQYSFDGGLYEEEPVGNILSAIFERAFPTGLIGYRLAESLAGSRLSGWLPVTNCRTALQQVCFALAATVNCGREGVVEIGPHKRQVSFEFPLERRYLGGEVEPTTYYSGVDLCSYRYTLSRAM